MLPALIDGQIAGSPLTDLYPSIWSLWATEGWWFNWQTNWLNSPTGQQWTPSCIVLGTLIIPLKPFISMASLYNTLILISRLLGCISFYMAGKAFGRTHTSGMLWMLVVAMSPMIHGFAVEGIVEGTQIWPLGFWLWSLKMKSPKATIAFAGLIILSNWYWACTWGIIQCLRLWKKPEELNLLILPIFLTAPLWASFLYQNNSYPIHSDVLRAMGFRFVLPTPNFLSPSNPFAHSTYVGWVLTGWVLWIWKNHTVKTGLQLVVVGFVLSIGMSWMQYFPVLSSIRFPYRLHLLTLIGLCIWIGANVSEGRSNRMILWLILLEQMTLSPIDWIIPSASSEYPDYTSKIDGPVLEIPGPLVRAPGTINPSKPRLRYLLYNQTKHAQPSGWKLGFNGLQTESNCFLETRLIDPYATEIERKQRGDIECWDSLRWIVVHNNNSKLDEFFTSIGFVKTSVQGPVLWNRAD